MIIVKKPLPLQIENLKSENKGKNLKYKLNIHEKRLTKMIFQPQFVACKEGQIRHGIPYTLYIYAFIL